MGRSLKKGPFCDDHLMKKIDELNNQITNLNNYIKENSK